MKVILYIGHHKVGSTALQVFLSQNWLSLARSGILYPFVESEGMAFAMATALRGKDRAGTLPINVREPHNALAFRMNAREQGTSVPRFLGQIPALPQMMRMISVQIEHLRPHTVVLCSEVMSNFGAINPRLVTDLKEMFPGASFEVYCTLRRPDEYLVSWQAQRLRFGEKPRSLESHWADMYAKSIHFDYRLLLEPWLREIKDGRFHVRTYSDVLASGGSAEDFVAQVGETFPDNMLPADRANPSLPLAFMEIVRRGNRDLEPQVARALFNLLLKATPPTEVQDKSRIEVFGSASREAMVSAFEPIHAYLGEATGRTPFFSDIDGMRRPREMPLAHASRLALKKLARIDKRSRQSPEIRKYLDALAKEYQVV